MIDMIAENAIASQQLMTAGAKVTIPNSATDPNQEHNCNQGPILVILKTQDAIMDTTIHDDDP